MISYELLHLQCDFFHSIRFKVNKVGRKRSPIFLPVFLQGKEKVGILGVALYKIGGL